jgi:multimeric flavodoxin WrbA
MNVPGEATSRQSTLVIMGSARSHGNTWHAVDRLSKGLVNHLRLVDLATTSIDTFHYELYPDRDQFLTVVSQITAHQQIVFATPVYWYAMSGLMKTLFDRLTDLLIRDDYRPLARALAGKDVWLLATGSDKCLPPGFEEPFARTAAYFGMAWRQAFYVRSIKGAPPVEAHLRQVDKLVASLTEGRA